MTEKEYNIETKNVIEFIKSYRLAEEDLHNLAPKDTISYRATEKCLKYWDMVLTSLQLDPIEVEAAKLQKAYEEGYNKGKNEFFNFDALEYLETAYAGARACDDVAEQVRLARAIAAYKQDVHEDCTVLDKIRAEIETERNAGCHTQYAGGLDFALSIIDKYKNIVRNEK